jgi:rod shape-determining protein MreD
MLRVVIVFLVQLLLWALLSLTNHYFAVWQIYIYAAGLFLVFPGLKMGPREGLAAAILSGLLFDAASPVGYGHNVILHATAFVFIYRMRVRLAYDERSVQSGVAILVNLALFLAKSVLCYFAADRPALTHLWGRFFTEILISSLFVGLLAPWAIALQKHSLTILELEGFKRQEEE